MATSRCMSRKSSKHSMHSEYLSQTTRTGILRVGTDATLLGLASDSWASLAPAAAVFWRTRPVCFLPGSKWDFEGDFATLDFVDLPMVDVRDERKDKRREGGEREGRDSEGRDKKQ